MTRETSQGLRTCAVPGPQIWFLASICWLTAVCSSSYRDLMCSSVSMGTRYTCGVTQNTHIHKIKIIKSLKIGCIEYRFYVKCSWNIIQFLFVTLSQVVWFLPKLLGLEVDLGEREEFEKYLNRLFWLRICSSRIQHLNATESDTFQASCWHWYVSDIAAKYWISHFLLLQGNLCFDCVKDACWTNV